MSGPGNGHGNALRYLILIASMMTIYFVMVGCFLTMWQLAQSLGVYVALSLCILASLIVLTLGSRALWGLVVKLSPKVS